MDARLMAQPHPDRPPAHPPVYPQPARQPSPQPSESGSPPPVPYAELHCHSAFSFLDGVTAPEQLVAEAKRLHLDALAITDHDGFYGAVQFAEAAQAVGLKTLYGAELSLDLSTARHGGPDPAGEHLLVLARGMEGYRRLSAQLTKAHLAGGEKGRPLYDLDTLAAAANGQWLILTGCRKGAVRRALARDGPAAAEPEVRRLVERFGTGNVIVELTKHMAPADDADNDALAEIAARLGLGVVATTAAHYATPREARLAAAVAAVRSRSDLSGIDAYLPAGPGAHLRSGAEMARLFPRYPTAVATAARIGHECAFDLHLVAPELPPCDVPPGYCEADYLRELAMTGALHRYGTRQERPDAYAQLDRELRVITDLNFPGYFLIVHDIVQFCRRENILCQGRGSAANSAVCYALGITAVDAVGYGLLFERFLSPAREGPPDIDIDIESGRREEVIQYVFAKYGRDRAAQVANVATYRPKMAVRDMAKALGHSPGQQDAYSKQLGYWGTLAEQTQQAEQTEQPGQTEQAERLRRPAQPQRSRRPAQQEPGTSIPADVLELAGQLQDLPRHLGIHSGGMVICDRPVSEVCPVEWARKENRSVLQWDKDDCAAIGLVKFDLLGLGMLSAIHEALDLVSRHEAIVIDLAALDLEEPAVYEMLQRADTVGVFQVESRAQMATLPRLKPERFYDLVVEIALIRPGPIQGGSVHPYLRRRDAVRAGTWRGPYTPHPAMERSLRKTLGIPLFQEQLMELAIDVAGFDAGQADKLRRAISSKRSVQKMQQLRELLYRGMRESHDITGKLADAIFDRLQAFGTFGFAESHALSFASLVFYSAYLKLHHPAAFLAALLRSQPMGFYSPQTLVADARRHGVTVRRAHINHSAPQADLEPAPDATPTVRLGLAGIRGIGEALAERIVAARPPGGYGSAAELMLAIQRHGSPPMTSSQAEALAAAGALGGLRESNQRQANRRQDMWAAGAAATARTGMLPGVVMGTDTPPLPGLSEAELTATDIWATGISPEHHPVEFTRAELSAHAVITAAGLYEVAPGTRVTVAGIVTHRQRPPTAGGVTFINLEDETGMVNVICRQGVWQRYRRAARSSRSLLVRGIIERDRGALSLLADRIGAIAITGAAHSRDFR